jgi:CheY-like chemotaxis protein
MSYWSQQNDVDVEGVFANIKNNIIAYQPLTKQWFAFPCDDAGRDWANYLFNPDANALLAGQTPPILLVNLGNICGGKTYYSELRLLDFVRFLRLSKYHPRAWGSGDYQLWRSPIICYSFESRESILRRRPEALVLYSPSVRFQRLPLMVSSPLIDETKLPAPANENELVKYINSTHLVNLSAHHYLGDVIGPYSILRAFKSASPQQQTGKKNFGTEVLREIFCQLQQEKSLTSEEDSEIGDGLKERAKQIHAAIADYQKLKRPAVLTIDDQGEEWKAVWEALLGPPGGWQRIDGTTLSWLIETANRGTYDNAFCNKLREYLLIILDLRLMPESDRDKKLEDISGYKLLRFIRTHDQAIPILTFTGSQRGSFAQQLRAAGSDRVCSKPPRFDAAPILLENLLESIYLLLQPEYRFLQETYYELKSGEAQFSAHDERKIPMHWALLAWQEARQNISSWIGLRDAHSAISVARTAGLASEVIVDKFGSNPQPYVYAVNEVRNVASHVKSAQVASVDIGYVALGLVTKMLSVLNDSLIQTVRPRERISSPNTKEIESELDEAASRALDRLQGAIRVATLAYAVRQNAVPMGLSKFLVKRLTLLEEEANGEILPMFDEAGICSSILDQLISPYPNLRSWLANLRSKPF